MLHLINGVQMDMSVINEVVKKGDVEIWRITNGTHTLSIFMMFSFKSLTESKAMVQTQHHLMKMNVAGKTPCY